MEPDRKLTTKDEKLIATTDKKMRELGFVLIPIELARRIVARMDGGRQASREDYELRQIIGDPPAVGGE